MLVENSFIEIEGIKVIETVLVLDVSIDSLKMVST